MANLRMERCGRRWLVGLVLTALIGSFGCSARHPAKVSAEPAEPPMPSAEEIDRMARIHRGMDPDSTGAIPPQDRWIGVAKEPPTRPIGTDDGSNIRVNQDASGQDQNETVISINPQNPRNLIGGANDYRTGNVKCGYYASLDGGLTWTDGVLPESTYPFQGDPVTAFCNDGSAIFVCLSFSAAFQPHRLVSYRSTDGGQSWSAANTIVNRTNGFPFADRPWAECDRTSSAFANRAYVTWSEIGLGTRIVLRFSTDGGQTWSTNRNVSDGQSTQGSHIAIGPNGEVYVAWSDSGRIGFDRSTNGGASFGVDVFPSTVDSISADPVFRRNSHPAIAADRTSGATSGNIYIAWADDRNGDPDILFVRSTDGGNTWSAPIVINDDLPGTGADQWFPSLFVDPLGRVIVTFYDRRKNPGGRPYEIWGAISRDGGLEFDTNFVLTEELSDGSLNGFIGDYSDVTASEDRLYALWTDLRAGTGETDAYTDNYPNTFVFDEVRGLRFTDRDTLEFDPQDARFGVDVDYDVTSGNVLDLLADRDYSQASCLAAAWGSPPFVDARVPAVGDGYYYLIRANGADGVGTYGYGAPQQRQDVRGPLDEAGSGTCP